ncbi:g8506 [Coccomyxa elongata]
MRRTPRCIPGRLAISRAASQNEVVEAQAPTEPTVFYGGNSYTESEWAAAVRSGRIADAQPVASSSERNVPDIGEIMAFSGPAPERINGRLAMLGFVAAVAAELVSGKGVLSQWAQEPTLITVTFVLFAAGSLAPLFNNADKGQSLGPFTPAAELINGRAAMIGFAALIGIEALKGSALF